MPWEEGVAITPLPEPGKPQYLSGYIEDAARRNDGACVNPGGGEVEATFFPGGALSGLAGDAHLPEEQFGPVVPVAPFDDVDEPLAHIVESNFGQQVSLFGRDPRLRAG